MWRSGSPIVALRRCLTNTRRVSTQLDTSLSTHSRGPENKSYSLFCIRIFRLFLIKRDVSRTMRRKDRGRTS